MAGSSNPNMVQPTTNPFMRASTANQQALNTYSNPGAAAANMMNPYNCLLYTSPSPRDRTRSRMPSSA